MSLKLKLTCVLLIGLSFLLYSFKKPAPATRILVFSKTLGWHHSCIPFGIAAIQKLGKRTALRLIPPPMPRILMMII
jgi:cytochrome c